jgi:hypothetical protein
VRELRVDEHHGGCHPSSRDLRTAVHPFMVGTKRGRINQVSSGDDGATPPAVGDWWASRSRGTGERSTTWPILV